MSTEMQSIQERIKAELANVRKSVAPPASNRISLQGRKFTLPNGTTDNGPMTAVVLDHRNFNRYYTKPYDPQNPVPPQCFAIAKQFEDLSPENHDNVEDPQASACSECPMNQFGSAPNGKGKACRNIVRLAIVAPDATTDTQPMTLEVPPSALKHWNRFVNDLETVGLIPAQVTVDISFDDSVAYPCPTFHAREAHDDIETFWTLRDKAQSMLDQPPAT